MITLNNYSLTKQYCKQLKFIRPVESSRLFFFFRDELNITVILNILCYTSNFQTTYQITLVQMCLLNVLSNELSTML